jgi:hypothetical protein
MKIIIRARVRRVRKALLVRGRLWVVRSVMGVDLGMKVV